MKMNTSLTVTRIKRSKLFHEDDGAYDSQASSRSVSPVDARNGNGDEHVNVNYGFEYDFVTSGPAMSEIRRSPQIDASGEAEEPEYQFRLFTSAPKSTPQVSHPATSTANTRIRLSPTPEPAALADALSLDKAHFLRPNRPQAYYFTSALPEKTVQGLKSQYNDIAVSTSDILSQAKSTKWPGTSLPWRLAHVELVKPVAKPNSLNQNTEASLGFGDPSLRGRSKKPSKKRRILLRRRLALRQTRGAQAKAAEETEREKRTRRNREKKVKKKEREKRKKLGTEREGDGAGEAAIDGDIDESARKQVRREVERSTLPIKNDPEKVNETTISVSNSSLVANTVADAVVAPPILEATSTSRPPPTRRAPTARTGVPT